MLKLNETILATDEFKFESLPDVPENWAPCEMFAGRLVRLFAKQRIQFRRKSQHD